jgi:hypothetical protein
MYGIKSLKGEWSLRLAEDLELEGLDISEHGTTAYHLEFGQGMSYTTPAGLPGIRRVVPQDDPDEEPEPGETVAPTGGPVDGGKEEHVESKL